MEHQICEKTLNAYLYLESHGEFLSSEGFFNLSDYFVEEPPNSTSQVYEIDAYEISHLKSESDQEIFKVKYTILGQYNDGVRKNSDKREVHKNYTMKLSENMAYCKIISQSDDDSYVLASSLHKYLDSQKSDYGQQLLVSNKILRRPSSFVLYARATLNKYLLMDGLGYFQNLENLSEFYRITNLLYYPFIKKNIIKKYDINYINQVGNIVQFSVTYFFANDKKNVTELNPSVKFNYQLIWNNNSWIIKDVPKENYIFDDSVVKK